MLDRESRHSRDRDRVAGWANQEEYCRNSSEERSALAADTGRSASPIFFLRAAVPSSFLRSRSLARSALIPERKILFLSTRVPARTGTPPTHYALRTTGRETVGPAESDSKVEWSGAAPVHGMEMEWMERGRREEGEMDM